jgi:hypothetical protein
MTSPAAHSGGAVHYLPPKRPGNFGGLRSNRLSRAPPSGKRGGVPFGSGRAARRSFVAGIGFKPGLRGFGVLRGIICTFRLKIIMRPNGQAVRQKALLRHVHCQGAPLSGIRGMGAGGLSVLVHCQRPPVECP